jgi:hypothetical protein
MSNDLTAVVNKGYRIPTIRGTALAITGGMDLSIWLLAMFLLGLAVLGLMFAFAAACAKV